MYTTKKGKGEKKMANKELKKENLQLLEIAKKNSYAVENRGDLEKRNNDSEDFLDISVWSLKEMLREAYELGKQSK